MAAELVLGAVACIMLVSLLLYVPMHAAGVFEHDSDETADNGIDIDGPPYVR